MSQPAAIFRSAVDTATSVKDQAFNAIAAEFHKLLEGELGEEEAFRAHPYPDPDGVHTDIGFGHNLSVKPLPAHMTPPISYTEGLELLKLDIEDAEANLAKFIPWTASMPKDARYGVLVDLSFNMGIATLMKFVHMLEAVKGGHFKDAAAQLLDSHYGKQVPVRAKRLAQQLVDNEWAPLKVGERKVNERARNSNRFQ